MTLHLLGVGIYVKDGPKAVELNKYFVEACKDEKGSTHR